MPTSISCAVAGKQLAKEIVNNLINFTSLSPLILAGLPLLSLSFWLMQSSAWPVSTYQATSIRIQKELGELWDAASSHLRKDSLGLSVLHPLQPHHPWLWRLFVSSQPRPVATFLLHSPRPSRQWRLWAENWTGEHAVVWKGFRECQCPSLEHSGGE